MGNISLMFATQKQNQIKIHGNRINSLQKITFWSDDDYYCFWSIEQLSHLFKITSILISWVDIVKMEIKIPNK